MWTFLFICVLAWAVIATAVCVLSRMGWAECERDRTEAQFQRSIAHRAQEEEEKKYVAEKALLGKQIAKRHSDYADLHEKYEREKIRANRLTTRLKHIQEHAGNDLGEGER